LHPRNAHGCAKNTAHSEIRDAQAKARRMTHPIPGACSCGHPAAYHTGPFTACGAMNCLCHRFEADAASDEPRAPERDDGDAPPAMECVEK